MVAFDLGIRVANHLLRALLVWGAIDSALEAVWWEHFNDADLAIEWEEA
jgi:hypothetical protein